MIGINKRRLALVAVTLFGFACFGETIVAAGRDDVPPEIVKMANPETLEDSEIRYYTRQFKGKCSRCHGKEGKGGGADADARLAPPTDFTDAAYMASRTDGQLFYQILMGGGDRCAMPDFGPESDQGWPEEKLWHLVAFVRRFSAGEAD